MKKFLAEFREFAMKGNVLDMAVGIIVGAAFTSIVNSLVDDIISPVIGLLVRVNFSDLAVSVFGVDLKYGSFIMAVINFVIVAFALFVLVKALNTIPLKKGRRKLSTSFWQGGTPFASCRRERESRCATRFRRCCRAVRLSLFHR